MNSGRRVLVTGADGFVGAFLVEELCRHRHEVYETVKPGKKPAVAGRIFPALFPDGERLVEILAAVRPDAVVHLAAMSFVPQAEAEPEMAISTNVGGARALLEALNAVDADRRIAVVLVSTGQVYRPPEAGRAEPIGESSPVEPASCYGRTKLAAELVAQCLARGPAACRPLVIFRPFNHSGPGQTTRFAISNFACQIARIEAGLQPPALESGDLEVERDFTDVRDVARAYRLAVEGRVPPGIYNIASGKAVSLRKVLETLKGFTSRSFSVRCPDSLRRAGEIYRLIGSAEKLKAVCGWQAEIALEETLKDSLEWWRKNIDRNRSGS